MDFCNLLPLLIGLGSALLGGWIGWLMRNGKIKELLGIVSNHEDSYGKLKSDHDANLKRHSLLQTDFDGLNDKHSEHLVKHNSLVSAHDQVNIEKNSLLNTFNSHKAESAAALSTAISTIKGLETKHADLTTAHQKTEQRAADLQTQLENTQKESKVKLTEAETRFTTYKNDSESKLTSIKHESETKFANLKSELDGVSNQNKSFTVKISELSEQKQAVENSLTAAKSDSGSKLAEATKQYQTLTTNYTRVVETEKKDRARIHQLGQHVHQLEGILHEMHAEHNVLSNKYSALVAVEKKDRTRIHQLGQHIHQVEGVIHEMHTHYKNAEHSLSAEKAKVAEVTKQLASSEADKQTHINSWTTKFNTLQTQHEATVVSHKAETTKLQSGGEAETQKHIQNWTAKYNTLQTNHDSTVAAHQAEKEQLHATINKVKGEHEALISDWKERYEEVNENYVLLDRDYKDHVIKLRTLHKQHEENKVHWEQQYIVIQKQHQELQTTHQNLQTVHQTHVTSSASSSKGQEEMKGQYTALVAVEKADKHKIHELGVHIHELEAKLHEWNLKHTEVEKMASTYKVENEAHQAKIREWNIKYESLNSEHGKLQTTYTTHKQSAGKGHEELQAKYDSLVSLEKGDKTKIHELGLHIHDLEARLHEWNLKHTAAEKLAATYKSENEAHQTKIREWNTKYESLNSEHGKLQTTYTTHKQSAGKGHEELQAKYDSLVSLEKGDKTKIHELGVHIHDLEARLHEWNLKHTAAEKQTATYKLENEAHHAKIHELGLHIHEVESKIHEWHLKYAEAEKHIATHKLSEEASQHKVHELGQHIHDLEGKLHSWHIKFEDLTTQYNSLATARATDATRMSQLSDSNGQLNIQLEECRTKYSSLNGQYTSLQGKYEGMKTSPTVVNSGVASVKTSGTKVQAKDDLKKIEGIGPKIEGLLHADGIFTFEQLSKTDPAVIKEILHKAGPRYQMHNPATWPEQSGMCWRGEWAKLKEYQEFLNGGKVPE
jgi:chromosome segregation ATPase